MYMRKHKVGSLPFLSIEVTMYFQIENIICHNQSK